MEGQIDLWAVEAAVDDTVAELCQLVADTFVEAVVAAADCIEGAVSILVVDR